MSEEKSNKPLITTSGTGESFRIDPTDVGHTFVMGSMRNRPIFVDETKIARLCGVMPEKQVVFDKDVTCRINPLASIKTDSEFLMAMLEQMAEIDLSPEQKELAKAIALREAEKGEVSMLTAVEAFEAEPTLSAFGAKLREVALPGAHGRFFNTLAG